MIVHVMDGTYDVFRLFFGQRSLYEREK